MNRVMVDTSAYSAFMRGHPAVKAALQAAVEIYISPVVLGELHAGFQGGTRRAANDAELSRFLSSSRVSVPEITDETALRYAEVFNFLKRSGTPVPINDIWIAAGAMQHGLKVLTTDAHYTHIPQVIVDYCKV